MLYMKMRLISDLWTLKSKIIWCLLCFHKKTIKNKKRCNLAQWKRHYSVYVTHTDFQLFSIALTNHNSRTSDSACQISCCFQICCICIKYVYLLYRFITRWRKWRSLLGFLKTFSWCTWDDNCFWHFTS